MSHAAVTDVLDRAMHDDAFLDRFHTTPGQALAEYDLTESERATLTSGDETAIHELIGNPQLDWQISITVVVV